MSSTNKRKSLKTNLPIRIADELTKNIDHGDYYTGQLPTIESLAHEFGVSHSSIHAAIRVLETRGVVRAYIGRGIFIVKDGESRLPDQPAKLPSIRLELQQITARLTRIEQLLDSLTTAAAGTARPS